MNVAQKIDVSSEDRMRADLFNFLGLLLSAPPDQMLLDPCARLIGDDSDLGQAIAGLARVARVSKTKAVVSEFNALFIGLDRGEMLTYASYYLTGFLIEKPLAVLRNNMASLSLQRAPNVYVPEDNIASLMEMMSSLIVGWFAAPVPVARQRQFFNRHVALWVRHFFSDLEGAKNSVLYASVGAVGLAFMEVERDAFRMTAG